MSTWRRDRTRLAGSRPRWYGGAPKGLKLKEWQEAPVAGPRSPGWLPGKCAQEHSFSLSVPGHWHETSDRFKTLASPYPLCTESSPPPHTQVLWQASPPLPAGTSGGSHSPLSLGFPFPSCNETPQCPTPHSPWAPHQHSFLSGPSSFACIPRVELQRIGPQVLADDLAEETGQAARGRAKTPSTYL